MRQYIYKPDIVAKTKIRGHLFVDTTFTLKFFFPAVYMNAQAVMVPIILYKGNWDAFCTKALLFSLLFTTFSAIMGTYGGPLKILFRYGHPVFAYGSLIPLGIYGKINGFDLLLILAFIVWGLIFWCIMGAGLGDPLKRMLEVLDKVRNGDLSSRVVLNFDRDDEIGRVAKGLNSMLDVLSEIINEVLGTVNKNTAILVDAVNQLGSQSEQTAASANETTATLEEVACTVEQVTGKNREISEKVSHTSKVADENKKGIENVKEQMMSINNATIEVSNVINELVTKSREINQIVDVITGIADQTNLLALNAAIEAAQAGEQGRGFAVVAEEVRKLAEQSNRAAGEIRGLIGEVQNITTKAETVMTNSIKDVEEGTEIISKAGQGFGEIITNVLNLADQMQEVVSASGEMNASVESIAATAEEQTSAIEEINSAVETLSKMSQELKTMTDKYSKE